MYCLRSPFVLFGVYMHSLLIASVLLGSYVYSLRFASVLIASYMHYLLMVSVLLAARVCTLITSVLLDSYIPFAYRLCDLGSFMYSLLNSSVFLKGCLMLSHRLRC